MLCIWSCKSADKLIWKDFSCWGYLWLYIFYNKALCLDVNGKTGPKIYMNYFINVKLSNHKKNMYSSLSPHIVGKVTCDCWSLGTTLSTAENSENLTRKWGLLSRAAGSLLFAIWAVVQLVHTTACLSTKQGMLDKLIPASPSEF